MAKFIEADYEKLDRLLELRETAHKRLAATEEQIREEKQVGSVGECELIV